MTLEFQAAIGQEDPHDRVRIEGEPIVDMRLAGGVHGDIATSAIMVNAVDSLLAAPAGLHTMATIPMAIPIASPNPFRKTAPSSAISTRVMRTCLP